MKLHRFSEYLNENDGVKKFTEAEVAAELELIKQEADLVSSLNDSNKLEILHGILGIRLKSAVPLQYPDDYLEWICDQVLNNKLPKSSSGSLYTAITDFDNIMNIFNPNDEEDEESEDEGYNEMIERLHRKILR